MSHQLERLLLHLVTIRAGWLRGVPVRATELDGQLEELLRLIVGANPGHVFRAHTVVARLAEGIGGARERAEGELAAIPSRRRAVRAHACLQSDPGVRLRRRA